MNESYLSTFGLKEPPFSKEIPDRDLWLPSSKAALVEDLFEALEERASVLLTGEPGVGKNCVLRALRSRLPQAGFRLTYCHNATLGRRDFYRQLCLALGLSPMPPPPPSSMPSRATSRSSPRSASIQCS